MESRLDKYLTLEQNGNVLASYVWIHDNTLHSKTKILKFEPKYCQDLPTWNFEDDDKRQVYLQPVAMVPDPFRRKPNVIALCETETFEHQPVDGNKRRDCEKFLKNSDVNKAHPWFALRQTFFIDEDAKSATELTEAHLRCCLYAGVRVSQQRCLGNNAWCFHVGPLVGSRAADEVWLARYLLERVAADFQTPVSLVGDTCEVTYSTFAMRQEKGVKAMNEALKTLALRHAWHAKKYGKIEEETAPQVHATVCIPKKCADQGKGYLLDKRPPSNCDPYAVIEAIVRTTLLYEIDDY